MNSDFSSWPRDQEQSFVVYEQRAQESSRKAFTIGGIVAGVWFVLLVGIYFGVAPEHKDMTKGMNMDNLTKKSKKSSAEAPAPTPAPKAEAKPAEAPAAPAAAPAEAPAAAPAAEEKK
jgi:pyruvate/2-oxoglutarate dehydrogenase complex dihydrolipoamide acyltransferase (E2) component